MTSQTEDKKAPLGPHSVIVLAILCCLSVAYIAFGGWVLLDPQNALSAMSLSWLDVANGKFELVSNYGGINLTVGLFCLWTICRPGFRVYALWTPLLLNAGYVLGRFFSLFIVGAPGGFVLGALIFEIIAFSLAFVGLKKL